MESRICAFPYRNSTGGALIRLEKMIKVGRIVGAAGLKGEVRVYSYAGSKESYSRWPRLYVDGLPREIRSVRYHREAVILKFAGTEDRTAAEALAGRELFLPAEDLPELPAGEYYVKDLLGLTVFALTEPGLPDGSARPPTRAETPGWEAGGVSRLRYPDEAESGALCARQDPGGKGEEGAGFFGRGAPETAAPKGFRKIGTLCDVVQNTAQDRYEIRLETGKKIMLPAVEDFILAVEPRRGRVLVRLPAGLPEY